MCGAGDQWLREAAAGMEAGGVVEKRALIIFVRVPELGKVKTRLAAGIGDAAALEAYRVMLAHTREVALATDCTRYLFYTPAIPALDEWDPIFFKKHLQGEGDLGQRMRAAFEVVLADGHDKALVIGSDCMDLRPSHLGRAYRDLALHEVVIGPANDGGYYLLGMRKVIPALFEGKEWSTDSVLRDSLADLEGLRLGYALLPVLRDVDTAEDWAAYSFL